MNSYEHVTVGKLERAIVIVRQIETLKAELEQVMGGETPAPALSEPKGRRTMSAAARAKIAAAQKARWATTKGTDATEDAKPKRTMSAAGRARISAAAKARWKKAKAAGKSTL